MKLIQFCEKCEKVETIESEDVKQMEVYDEERNSYRLTYYTCSKCKHINPLQIDSPATVAISGSINALLMSVMKKRENGVLPSEKSKRRYEKLNKQLDRKRKNIIDKLEGNPLYNYNKNIVVEHLTLKSEGDIIESDM